MIAQTAHGKLLTAISLFLWAALIFMPLATLFVQTISPAVELETTGRISHLLFRSFGLAFIIAAAAVLLGYIPGLLLGTLGIGRGMGRDLVLLLLLAPLVLPRYVLYYAWGLLLSPTTELGQYIAARGELARFVGTITSLVVLILWYWPLAALLIGQGRRNIDRQIWDCARLDANALGRFKEITLPLMGRTLLLAFGVCFVLSLSEFTTFHLAGIQTIGTELAVMYELTGSESYVARTAWPIAAAAIILAITMVKSSRPPALSTPVIDTAECESGRWQWVILITLFGISLVGPLLLLVGNVTGTQAFRQFFKLHLDELGWSAAIASAAAGMAHLIAVGSLSLERNSRTGRWLSLVIQSTIFLAMLVPGSLVAVSLLKVLTACQVPVAFRQSWFIVSAGQAARFSGISLILLFLIRHRQDRQLSEMASLDGASRLKAWWYVHLPGTWPVFVGSFLLVFMFGMTELSTTMVLLPAGLPNFAQRLLNQMHYARDQQVIASCLILIGFFLLLTAALVLLLRLIRIRCAMLVIFAVGVCGLIGCDSKSNATDRPEIVNVFGGTGRGQGEFMYPRAIDIAPDGSLFIIDKTGRIQRFDPEGNFLGVFQMPLIEAGKPTGLSFATNGNLYVADTHYHRVLIFSFDGKIVGEFGRFGQEAGCFIYLTDVAFSGDGRIFVSEYGGNDRISVFSEKGDFLYCFGAPGSGPGDFARPAALCVDRSRGRLYVADACNHRIAIYNFDGKLLGYIGSAGRAAGQLRYPYDLALLSEGTLAVCEYGNNRVQLFSPEGRSLGVYGRPGRRLGELAYPWGLAVDDRGCVFVVDAGNNRIQVWRL
ncbi:MAG: 6-bladed beta-propeller [Sedimentisphaerales bacterium]|nr:6-bladed beta-propeller [Sedimentisphaerales bacterium]